MTKKEYIITFSYLNRIGLTTDDDGDSIKIYF